MTCISPCAQVDTSVCWCPWTCLFLEGRSRTVSGGISWHCLPFSCLFGNRVSHWSRALKTVKAAWAVSPRDPLSVSPRLGWEACLLSSFSQLLRISLQALHSSHWISAPNVNSFCFKSCSYLSSKSCLSQIVELYKISGPLLTSWWSYSD